MKDAWPEYQKRDLTVMVISPVNEEGLRRFAEEESVPVILISDESRETMNSYGIRGVDSPVIYLIGKDGTVKISWTHWPTNQEIFQSVDSMPMRQQEMQERFEAA